MTYFCCPLGWSNETDFPVEQHTTFFLPTEHYTGMWLGGTVSQYYKQRLSWNSLLLKHKERLLLVSPWVAYKLVEEVSVADPPNYSGHNIIKFSILPGGPRQYYYDTKLKEKEFFKSQEISEKQSLGKCCKVRRRKKSVNVAQEKKKSCLKYNILFSVILSMVSQYLSKE